MYSTYILVAEKVLKKFRFDSFFPSVFVATILQYYISILIEIIQSNVVVLISYVRESSVIETINSVTFTELLILLKNTLSTT